MQLVAYKTPTVTRMLRSLSLWREGASNRMLSGVLLRECSCRSSMYRLHTSLTLNVLLLQIPPRNLSRFCVYNKTLKLHNKLSDIHSARLLWQQPEQTVLSGKTFEGLNIKNMDSEKNGGGRITNTLLYIQFVLH